MARERELRILGALLWLVGTEADVAVHMSRVNPCACASSIPGMTSLPPRSIRRVAAVPLAAICCVVPIARMRAQMLR